MSFVAIPASGSLTWSLRLDRQVPGRAYGRIPGAVAGSAGFSRPAAISWGDGGHVMERLAGVVQPYAWGSPTVIPELLGVEPSGEPQAELWFGAHPLAPSIAGGRAAGQDRRPRPRGGGRGGLGRRLRAATALPAQDHRRRPAAVAAGPPVPPAGRGGLRPRGGRRRAARRAAPYLPGRLAQARGAVRAPGHRGACAASATRRRPTPCSSGSAWRGCCRWWRR